MSWYIAVLKKYADFSGRARRKEFWMFFLFNFIFSIVISILSTIATGIDSNSGSGSGGLSLCISGIALLYSLGILIPSLAVAVRRLHDIGKSGWWLFIGLIPLIGVIWLLVLYCTDSQPGTNQYGPNPKEVVQPAESSKSTTSQATQSPQPTTNSVNPSQEEPNFLKALVDEYGKGNEFKARDAFQMISEGYLDWYGKEAAAKNTYLINPRESAALELLEDLYAKGLLTNKRKEITNEYGDEEWYYTLR